MSYSAITVYIFAAEHRFLDTVVFFFLNSLLNATSQIVVDLTLLPTRIFYTVFTL